MIFHIFHVISGWSQVSSTPGGPGAASTPNLPTSTPKHQAIYVTSSIRPSVSKITSETSLTSSSTSQSHLRSQINGSSSQLSKAEEKIQGRGMCRSSATYGIQQLLQEQVCNWKSFLALPRSLLALRDRFWPCEISINVPQLKSFIHGAADCFMNLFIFNCVFMRFNSLKSENVSRDKACIKSHRTS